MTAEHRGLERAAGPRCRASSAIVRAPAPSETTAARSLVSAAASSISSPPTDRPMPPMRSGSTSVAGLAGSAIAALMSSSPPQPKHVRVALAARPRRGGRTAARRSRGGRACAPGAAGPCARGTRSPRRRCCDGTYQPSSFRPSLGLERHRLVRHAERRRPARRRVATWAPTYAMPNGSTNDAAATSPPTVLPARRA